MNFSVCCYERNTLPKHRHLGYISLIFFMVYPLATLDRLHDGVGKCVVQAQPKLAYFVYVLRIITNINGILAFSQATSGRGRARRVINEKPFSTTM